MMLDVMTARAEHRVYRKMAYELVELAKQTDCPVYLGDKEVDSYVKLSDVLKILQENAPMSFPLLDNEK